LASAPGVAVKGAVPPGLMRRFDAGLGATYPCSEITSKNARTMRI
jgi:hypothetical protein